MGRPRKEQRDDGARQVPSAKVLKDLARQSDTLKDRQATATGTLGQAIKDAAEKHALNPIAWRMADRWRRMKARDPVKARTCYEDCDLYLEQMEVDMRAAGDMFRDRPAEETAAVVNPNPPAGGEGSVAPAPAAAANGSGEAPAEASQTPAPEREVEQAHT
jgi:hypothetical protein